MSNDLISRKTLMEALKTHFDADYNEDGRLLYSDHICTGEDVEDLIKLVDAQPTAYNPDKVVEQLEEELSKAEKRYHRYAEEEGLSCMFDMSDIAENSAETIKKMLEIVERGGANET